MLKAKDISTIYEFRCPGCNCDLRVNDIDLKRSKILYDDHSGFYLDSYTKCIYCDEEILVKVWYLDG
jgi:hypothetical protein